MKNKYKTLYNVKLYDSFGNLKDERNVKNYVTPDGLCVALDLAFMRNEDFTTYYGISKNNFKFYIGLLKTAEGSFDPAVPLETLDQISKYHATSNLRRDNEFITYKVRTIDILTGQASDLPGDSEETQELYYRSELLIKQPSESYNGTSSSSNYVDTGVCVYDTRRQFLIQQAGSIYGIFLTNKIMRPNSNPVKNTYINLATEKLYGVTHFSQMSVAQNDMLYITATLSASSA